MDPKSVIGGLAVLVGLAGYVPYFFSIAKGRTRPHVFTWLVWCLILVTAFGVQVSAEAGPGAWLTGLGAVACLVVLAVAIFRGTRSFSATDWLALAAAVVAFVLWRTADDPSLAAVMVTAADMISYLPTLRKVSRQPESESVGAFIVWGLASALSLAAIESYSLATWLYPSLPLIMNPVLILIVLRRRSAHARAGGPNVQP